ncbi:hypothetical protein J591_1491 [Acinetobacter baumannii 532279]|uniref:toll/interleukin-1 receptor domain-containing protein n=1 Tax=Acinetobacter baumannii TaxID=470 RepID=UPI00044FF935|nr:toll/interleukin-1 receptor domain-containing protein [Acinetobacter baumannii]EXE88615.1 hypothetical protein J591_1491 [Acinetobacter baumannii 532279]
MYKSIQIEDFDFSIFPYITDRKVNTYKERNKNTLINIQDYLLNKKNTLSVEKIYEKLFVNVKPDIFLSHSHADEDDVIRLAILIEEELNLKVFIDSCIWGDAFKLLREIDKSYCLNGSNFNYRKRNYTTSNIFMILNSALNRVIYNCEAFIFLGTDNSIPINEVFENKKYLSSPWIYSELQFAKLVRRTPKPRQISIESRDQALAESLAFDNDLNFAYPLPETDATLSNQKLKKWIEAYQYSSTNRNIHPLDILYKAISYR